jgi:Fe-S-cluster-containing hydrogenase component 2
LEKNDGDFIKRNNKMKIEREKCSGCGGCINLCPVSAIYFRDDRAVIDVSVCTECGTCIPICGCGAPQE